jgi:lysophospholipase L1-like esterase
MKKTVLCYGDSNTWGAIPEIGGRLPIHERWPGVMRDSLGNDYWVIEEGLCGRTTIWVDEVCRYRTGWEYLLPCLDTHAPVDLLIIMLGTNDLKTRFHLPAEDIARGVIVLGDMAMKSEFGPGGSAPEVLIVSPPAIIELPGNQAQFADGVSRSQKFGALYREYAKQYGAHFLDAGKVVTSSLVDGIHLDVQEHQSLGVKIAEKVKNILE